MHLDIKNGINIESKSLMDKILYNHISQPSFSPSYSPPPLFTNV